jgi:hypothetical protein
MKPPKDYRAQLESRNALERREARAGLRSEAEQRCVVAKARAEQAKVDAETALTRELREVDAQAKAQRDARGDEIREGFYAAALPPLREFREAPTSANAIVPLGAFRTAKRLAEVELGEELWPELPAVAVALAMAEKDPRVVAAMGFADAIGYDPGQVGADAFVKGSTVEAERNILTMMHAIEGRIGKRGDARLFDAFCKCVTIGDAYAMRESLTRTQQREKTQTAEEKQRALALAKEEAERVAEAKRIGELNAKPRGRFSGAASTFERVVQRARHELKG